MLAYLSRPTSGLALLLLLALLGGCGGSSISKEEAQQIQNPPTREIPPHAQAVINEKMRESQEKMRQQTQPPTAPQGGR